MTPYYSDDKIVIYYGDCAEVLPALSGYTSVITDPPYGLMEDDKKLQMRGGVVPLDYGDWDCACSFDWVALVASATSAVVFHEQKRASACWDALVEAEITPRQYLFWDKGDAGFTPRRNYVNVVEQALYGRRGVLPWNGGGATINIFRRNRSARLTEHPTEKPEDLMAWIIRVITDSGETILDPFCGSGTTLVAAKRLGRKAIGIEREERYCEIAARRLAQRALPMDLI